jgi:osmotically inducible protein OsmC
MERTATAIWNGNLREGKGAISTESQFLKEVPYTFATRFENGKGTNPEELIAAAHAGCFTMALSAQLTIKHFNPESLRTTATVSLEKDGAGWSITKVHLEVAGRVPGVSAEDFETLAKEAKLNCPVSKLLKAEVSLTAHLEQAA